MQMTIKTNLCFLTNLCYQDYILLNNDFDKLTAFTLSSNSHLQD